MEKFKKHLLGVSLLAVTLLGIWGSSSSKKTNTYSYTPTQPRYTSIGSMDVNPSTNKITNWSGRIQFNYTYTYDFDLKKATSESYSCGCLVVVEIDNYGTGRLVTSLGGNDKNILTITSCYKNSNGTITINSKNQYGTPIASHFSIVNSYYTDKFWIVNSRDNGAVVFSM